MCRVSTSKPLQSPKNFLWFPVATPITGENRRRQIVIAAMEMERKVGQGHSYDLRTYITSFLHLYNEMQHKYLIRKVTVVGGLRHF